MQNVKYPKIAMEWGVQGRVLAQFVVEKDGSITNVKAIRINNEDGNEIKEGEKTPDMTEEQKQTVDLKNAGLRSLKDESVRVLNLMPKWTPAKQKGKPVRVRFTVPVTFRLQ